MKKAILLPLALLLVGGLVYAADLSGKVEAKATLPGDGGDFTEAYGVEANINASVDDYNSATIELRGVPESGAASGSEVTYGALFLESDLGGALGITEASGVGLKIKAGDFTPETTGKGRISDNYIGTSDVVNGNLGGNGVGTNLVISYTDLVQLTIGLDLAADADFNYFFDVSGSTDLGPGTLGYAVFYSENDSVGFYENAKAMEDNDLSSRTSLGVEVQYANIAIADNFTIGVGVEVELPLDAPDVDNIVLLSDGGKPDKNGSLFTITEDNKINLRDRMSIGANLVANFDSWLGLEVGFRTYDVDSESALNSLNDFDTLLGIGLGLSTPDGIMGINLPFELDLSANDEQVAGTDGITEYYNENSSSFAPKIWLKAGATEFSVEYAFDLYNESDRKDTTQTDVDNSRITFAASLGF